jgi:uncharacterized protein (TIGR02444 family)
VDAPAERPETDSPFWRFSLKFYALPEVAPACLRLQDEGGADVNLLLFLLFLAQSCRQVRAEDIHRLDSTVAPWREGAVEPLRALRRKLKEGIKPITTAASQFYRDHVKRLELEAERLEQSWLEREGRGMMFATAPSREAAAETNLSLYAAYLGRLPEAPLKIVLAAFTNAPP